MRRRLSGAGGVAAAGLLVVTVVTVGAAPAAASTDVHVARLHSDVITFNVPLAATSVTVDNWSIYDDSPVAALVQLADRGMATTDPADFDVPGEMEQGDRVVVTNAGIYWLDVVRRGGLLSGVWPLVAVPAGPSGSYDPAFAHTPSGHGWEPNSLLPGSTGDDTSIYDTGQAVNVLATGGEDGSCQPGRGTFVISGSANCGLVEGPMPVSLASSSDGDEHFYTVSGLLYQEGTDHYTLMADAEGDTARMRFDLTYIFAGATDGAFSYGPSGGPDQQRVRTDLTLVPSAPIDLGTLVVADVSDHGAAGYPYRDDNFSDTSRQAYVDGAPCGPATMAPGAVGTICEGPAYSSNWISQPNRLPATLVPGDFVTEQETTAVPTTGRSLTVMLPLTTAYRLPERIDHIWNQGLGVSSLDVDYFNQEQVPMPAGTPLHLGFDLQADPLP